MFLLNNETILHVIYAGIHVSGIRIALYNSLEDSNKY